MKKGKLKIEFRDIYEPTKPSGQISGQIVTNIKLYDAELNGTRGILFVSKVEKDTVYNKLKGNTKKWFRKGRRYADIIRRSKQEKWKLIKDRR